MDDEPRRLAELLPDPQSPRGRAGARSAPRALGFVCQPPVCPAASEGAGVRAHARVCVYIRVCVHVHNHVRAWARVCVCVCMYTPRGCLGPDGCVRACVCVCVCVCARVCVPVETATS